MHGYSDSQYVFLIMRKTTCLNILMKLQHADSGSPLCQYRAYRQPVCPAPHSLTSAEDRFHHPLHFVLAFWYLSTKLISRKFKYFCHSVREPLTKTTYVDQA